MGLAKPEISPLSLLLLCLPAWYWLFLYYCGPSMTRGS